MSPATHGLQEASANVSEGEGGCQGLGKERSGHGHGLGLGAGTCPRGREALEKGAGGS